MRIFSLLTALALLGGPVMAQGTDIQALAQKGDANAQYTLGSHAWHTLQPDYGQACDWLTKAADQGHARAAYELASLYDSVDHFTCAPKTAEQMLALYKQAADGGVTEADAQVGLAYATGNGVTADPAQMIAWYRKGAQAGDPPAERLLGEALRFGIGVDRDVPQAISWLTKASDRDAEAEAQLAAIHYDGDGVQVDYAQAFSWAQKAAQAGSAEGAYYVGLAQENGRGTKQDYDAALTAYGAAYEQGHDGRPLVRIGVMLCNGWGEPKDPDSALKALHAAATPSTPEAFFAMGDIYAQGTCVPRDLPRAYAWKRLGILFRDGDVDKWPAELNPLSDQLTADQKGGIDALTREVAAEVGMSVDANP